MRRLPAFLIAVLTPLVASAQPYPINPGFWEVTTNWLGLVSKTERYCVAPKDIPRFMSGPCNHIYHCTYPVERFENGKSYFDGEISGHDESYHVHGGGDYSPTTLNMRTSISGHWHIVPVSGPISVTGHFVSADCPADAKHIRDRPKSQ
ncbi:MAG TPA: hypothetical protein VHW60_11935 [Caulobacteraceae bacterium]|nr:hypothetical protein [Caulobacteraceae bacterium]